MDMARLKMENWEWKKMENEHVTPDKSSMNIANNINNWHRTSTMTNVTLKIDHGKIEVEKIKHEQLLSLMFFHCLFFQCQSSSVNFLLLNFIFCLNSSTSLCSTSHFLVYRWVPYFWLSIFSCLIVPHFWFQCSIVNVRLSEWAGSTRVFNQTIF